MKLTDQEKLKKAKKRLEQIKGFYIHATIYGLVNLFLLLSAIGLFSNGFVNLHMPGWANFTTPFFWGIGLMAHGINTFKPGILKSWEERKIKEYLEKEEHDFNKFN